MKVIYTAPNRGHHYKYALALAKAGILGKFVSGFSRFSPRAGFPEIGSSLVRADWMQNIFLASIKLKLPSIVSKKLAFWAKKEQDLVCKRYLQDADIFLFYSGSGLNTCKKALKSGTINIVEAVNSHVVYQEELLKEEHLLLGLPWIPFDKDEKNRRIKEYELADYILLPSEFVKKSFLEYGFSEEKLIKVPYGFNQGSIDIIDNPNLNDDFTILYVGSISVRKGLIYLLEAFKQLQHPRKKLVVVGPKAIPSGLEGVKIPENVVFTGVLKGAELDAAYRSANVFCLPSIEEGLALVLGEALSFGVPIVATENTGVFDIITDGSEGFIVPIRNSKVIAEKIQMLVDDKDLYLKMKDSARNRSKELNGWDETGLLLSKSLFDLVNKQS